MTSIIFINIYLQYEPIYIHSTVDKYLHSPKQNGPDAFRHLTRRSFSPCVFTICDVLSSRMGWRAGCQRQAAWQREDVPVRAKRRSAAQNDVLCVVDLSQIHSILVK